MRHTRLAAAILLLAYVPACTSYQVMTDPSTGLLAPVKPVEEVRITLRTGERFELNSPLVYGDSLKGFQIEGSARSVAMGDMTEVEVRKPSAGKTVGLVLGIAVAAGLVAGGIAMANYEPWSLSFEGLDAAGW
jgi:hypothetical protein